MPSRNTTSAQRAALARVRIAKGRYDTAVREIEDRVRGEVEKELSLLRLNLQNEVREAYSLKNDLGEHTSYADLKRAYGTKDHKTIRDMLATYDPIEVEVTQQFEVDKDAETFTVHWMEVGDSRHDEDVTYPLIWKVNHWTVDIVLDDDPYWAWADNDMARMTALVEWDDVIKGGMQ